MFQLLSYLNIVSEKSDNRAVDDCSNSHELEREDSEEDKDKDEDEDKEEDK